MLDRAHIAPGSDGGPHGGPHGGPAPFAAADLALLDRWQRGFPLVPRPFAEIALAEGLEEAEVLSRLRRLKACGAVSRLGATARPNAAGASTLAALSAPPEALDAVAALVNAEAGVNHSYAREHAWNLWFVQTGPDRAAVDAALDRIRAATGLEVLDLPLLRPFNIDLGFSLKGAGRMAPPAAAPAGPVSEAEKRLLQALSEGLELTARPYAALGARFGLSEAGALVAVRAALERGLAGRFGLILNHRRLGFTANAMCVWALEEAEADAIGPALAAQPGVTLCYRRRADAARWPYTLYAMIHGRRRAETLAALDAATRGAGLAGRRREVLFSTRCYRQRGALIHRPDTERAHA